MFPKRDHVNIGIGYVLSHYRLVVDEAPYDVQRAFVARLRDRRIVVGESMRKNFTPFIIPIGGPLREPGRGRVLVAGDAGGFVNAFTAEGIYYAMVSGDLAAQAILTSTSDDLSGLARRYSRSCDYEIGVELRDSVRIQRYRFGNRRRIARIIGGAHREQTLIRLILEFVIGRRSYRNLRRRMLVRSPSLACRVAWERLTKKLLSSETRVSSI